MPEMELESFEVDGERLTSRDLESMTEQEVASIYYSLVAGQESKPAIEAVSADLIRRGIF